LISFVALWFVVFITRQPCSLICSFTVESEVRPDIETVEHTLPEVSFKHTEALI